MILAAVRKFVWILMVISIIVFVKTIESEPPALVHYGALLTFFMTIGHLCESKWKKRTQQISRYIFFVLTIVLLVLCSRNY